MSEHMFGGGTGELTDEAIRAIDEIAARHDFTVVTYTEPRGEKRYWFAGPNRGNPFDGQAEKAIWADLEAAGWANARGLSARCFEPSEERS